MQTHYVDDNASKIQTALATPEMRTVSHSLRASGVPKITEPLRLSALDKYLEGSSLTVAERIALKSAMGRAGLLV